MNELYYIKIGNRYLSWVDENWYETNKKEPTYFNYDELINSIKLLEKHYVLNPTVFRHYDDHDYLCFVELKKS